MKKRSLLRLIIIVVLIVGLIGLPFKFLLLPLFTRNSAKNVTDQLLGWKYPVAKFPSTGPSGNLIAYSNIRDPGGVPKGLPVRLKIPVIGVDSAIEDALITPDGRMDVPAGTVNVAWFALGPQPGQIGSAVIGGHFGIDKGVPRVFYNLNKLRVGDKVYIVDDNNNTLAFMVGSTRLFDRNADATTVFTSSDNKAHLNLITCEGIWNQVNNSYPQRLVVFTDKIAGEGAVVVKKMSAAVVPTLPVTAIGAPKLTSTPTPTQTPTMTPVPMASNKIVSSSPQIISYLASLYDNIPDGVISSLLIVAIAFIALKIIKR